MNVKDKDGTPVPFGRLSRLAGLGGMAAGVAGNMMLSGAKELASGKRPRISDMLLTPGNAMRVTRKLSQMRGAAMKIGQMISMESGDLLPKELVDILATLRAEARHMPRAQLLKVLVGEWGECWRDQFESFDMQPFAAASIGQVHRARLRDGRMLAIKVQYPGVKDSIDSDVKNVATLIRMTGLLPSHLDITPIIEAARIQLHEEADYKRESAYLKRFGGLLEKDDRYAVPKPYPLFSTDKILTMSYLNGRPVEDMADASQQTRNRIALNMAELVMKELFEFGVMQTDPNFANYRYDTDSGKIILFDFGASRDIGEDIAASYRDLLSACLTGDSETCLGALQNSGFMPEDIPSEARPAILNIIDLTLPPLSRDAPYDFGDSEMVRQVREQSMTLASNRALWHVPPPELAFIQRKLGGVYLLAARLKAQANLHALIKSYL